MGPYIGHTGISMKSYGYDSPEFVRAPRRRTFLDLSQDKLPEGDSLEGSTLARMTQESG